MGSYVEVRNHKTLLRSVRPTKIDANYKGPFRMINNLGSRYTVQNLVTMKDEVYLAADLQPFWFDPNVVARDSVNEFDIRSIIDIRGLRRKNKWAKSTVEFLV